ncbi:uncharacterized protein LOC111434529 [Cucurbita moschata]|uniref:Uncharacterized protein LOC111434529 n=1 Tax=Cucurbita moschata TaxID=3662 RepID=A0A6J1EPR7_CUCMO|nr:uncharacterized protein LOC111434529 [Cucurbita moschata]
MTVIIGLKQSMTQTNGQLAQLIPTLAQSARQTTHHNQGDVDALEESKYFWAFKRRDPKVFEEKSKDPDVAELWLSAIDEIFRRMKCLEEHRLSCVTYLLREDAKLWWQSASRAITADKDDITWMQFRKAFLRKYFKPLVRYKKQREFLSIEQENRSVEEYEREFTRLSRFAPIMVSTEVLKVECFVMGLRPDV